eukprot:996938_1
MSKRSRQDFEGTKHVHMDGIKHKRRKSEGCVSSNHSLVSNAKESEFECPVCFEEFTNAIYQCVEGHLLCHLCRPKFTLCPTCRVSLETNIRNRILEQILSTKTNSKPRKKDVVVSFKCNLCNASFNSQNDRNQHCNQCEARAVMCPFMDCKWKGTYSLWLPHAQETHHTANGSKQPMNENHKTYTFHHAIKFPRDTLSRANPDFVWPKIVQFEDGKEFFILSRFTKGFITIFVRLMRLSRLKQEEIENMKAMDLMNTGEGDVLGEYWIEFKTGSKEKNNSNKNKNKDKENEKMESIERVPLRWPSDLYGITVPFNYEKRMHQMLRVHHSMFTKYWAQPNANSSAVLRFQFQAVLK